MELRVAAYAVVIGDDEAMLLAHWNDGPGRSAWTLPGGGLEPGEHPADAAVREVREETGYAVELDELIGVDSIVIPADQRPTSDEPVQLLRIVYRAHVVGGELTDEADGSTDEAAWFSPREVDDLDRVELVDTARRFAGWEPPEV